MELKINFLIVFIFIVCSYGWKYFNNNCYLLSNYYNDFLGANDFCQDLNSKANIVMPTTQDVINFIANNWQLSYDFWVNFIILY